MRKIPVLYILLLTIFTACDSNNQYNVSDENNYKEQTQNIKEVELKNPTQFISVTGKEKKNLLGKTVVNGIIYNRAKMAEFQDVELKMKFYSKTGALLEENVETVYEKISPGGSVKFKTKIYAHKGIDSLQIEVMGAKGVE